MNRSAISDRKKSRGNILLQWIFLLILLVPGLGSGLFAQPNLIKAEYFFDTDPGFGQAQEILPFTPATVITGKTFSANIGTLAAGVHQMYVRVKDANGNWSISNRTFFYKAPAAPAGGLANIVRAEYFFDTEPGFGSGTEIPVMQGTTIFDHSFSANVEGLSPGVHQMFIRVKDANGLWSITNRTFFYKAPAAPAGGLANLVKAEYFFDTEPGFGSGTDIPVTPGTTLLDKSFSANVDALSPGVHQMFLRVKDASGKWSISNRTFFYKAPAAPSGGMPNIVRAEYFFDAEPGFGNGTGIPVTAGTTLLNQSFQANVDALPSGIHQLFVRVKDANGKWSISNRTFFYKAPASANGLPARIVKAEYFIDTDPGFGKAVPYPVTAATQLTSAVINVSVNGLSNGTHKFCLRTLDENGKWSITNISDLEVTNAPTGPYLTVTGSGKTNLCAGDNFPVGYQAAGTFNAGNIFTIQLSDETGNFGTPHEIGSLTGTASGSIYCTVPGGLTNGNAYRVRVVSTNPVFVSEPLSATFSTTCISNTPPSITLVNKTDLTCAGANNGAIDISISEGNAPYIITWQKIGSPGFGSNNEDIAGLSPGDYRVIVTDATSNASALQISIASPEVLTASVTKTDITCSIPGSATLSISGGTIPYAVSWSNGATGTTLSGVVAGTYNYTVTDGNSCSINGSVTLIGVPNSLNIEATGTHVNCFGGSNGTATVSVSGAINPITYAWSNGANTQSINGLTAGNYGVTVSDANGCSASASVTVTEPPALSANAIKNSDETCAGLANGSATVSATGGTLISIIHYSYLWDNGETGATAVALGPGTHTVTVTDAKGCTATASVSINAGAAVPLANVSISGPTTLCNGETVTLTASAGTSYLWSNGAATQSVTVGATGNYSVTVTNAAGCSSTSSAIHVMVSPAPVWYIDNDEDGYGTGATVQACTRPAKGFASGELTSTTGDCDDNNPNINATRQRLAFSTNTGFTTKIIDEIKGTSYSTFRFEVDYFDENNQLPLGSYPRVILDYEGNGNYTDANDRMISMVPADANDNNTADGKRYVVSFSGLPYGTQYQTRILVNDVNNCGTQFGPFNYPDVVQQPNLQIFANDIRFSKFRTAVGETITISADVHNTSDQPAENFLVKLQSQYNPAESFPNQTVAYLAPYGLATVSWTITTPAIPAWVPMQVLVDQTDVITESNELDNSALRPYVNGDYPVPGEIVTTANPSPSVINLCYSSNMNLSGKAIYTNTAVTLPDPSVAGATVEFTITETGATYSGYTNSLGNYLISFPAPPPGTYHITGTTTDYTLTGNFTATFSVVNQCPVYEVCPLPNLTVQLSLNSASILQGSSVNGTVVITNSGIGNLSQPTQLALSLSGGATLPQTGFNIPALNAGASYSVNINNLTFNSPGYFTFYANADATQLVSECNESDNYRSATLEVRPNLPDIRPYSGPAGSVYNCPNPATGFTVENIGGVAAGPFDIRVVVRKGLTVKGTYIHHAPGIGYGGNRFYYFTVPHTYSEGGLYSFDIECDIEVGANGVITELREDNNTAEYNEVFNVLPCKPDLYVITCSNPVVMPVNPSGGGNITLNATIGNAGNATTAGPFTVRFSYSSGEAYNVPFNGTLAPYQQTQVIANVPAPAAPGVSLTVTIDPGNTAIDELNEDNNTFTGALCHELQPVPTCNGALFASGPPLLLYRAATPWVPIRTNGLYLAQNVKVKFEVLTPSGASQNLGTMTLGSTLSSCNCPTIVSLDQPYAFNELGTYTFTFTVDPDNEFAECNEGNNVLQTQILVINQPDMRILSQYINPTKLNPAPGENVTFNISYENLGRANVPDSMNLRILVDGQYHDQVRAGGLVQGDKKTRTIPTPWSSSIYGAHIIRAIIDAGNEVAEMDELNNEATRAIIVGAAANLYFHSFTSSNATPLVNEAIQLNATIKNQGDQACTAKVQFFYKTLAGVETYIGEIPFNIGAQGQTSVEIPWIVELSGTTLIARIVNVSELEFRTDDNEATTQIGSFGVTLLATEAACLGGEGSLAAQATGGSGNYTYSWNNLTNGAILHATQGTYRVTVTDNETGQQISVSGEITAIADHTDPEVVTCTASYSTTYPVVTWSVPLFSDNCGPLNITSNHSPGETFPPGNTVVTYTATDPSGNSAQCSFTVTVLPPTYLVNISGTPSVPCFGSRTGSLTATPTGGTAPYTYLWSNGKKTATISNLPAGTYTVTVTDANLNLATNSYTITQPDKVTGTVVATSVTCHGNADGKLEVTAAGGTPGYVYSLDGINYQPSGLFENLAPGSYTIRIKDANNCTGNARGTVREPGLLTAGILTMTPACYGSNTGSIYVTIAGGTNPKTYAWTGPNGFTSTAKNIKKLAPGMYNLTVTDLNGCTASTFAEVTSYNQYLSNVVVTNTTCRMGNDGAINLTPSGGSGAGFTAAWTGPNAFTSSSEDIAGLVPGTYKLALTDTGTGCVLKENIVVGQPTSSPMVAATVTPVNTCGGSGSINATGSNGDAPFQYSINGGAPQSSGLFTGLLPATYSVTAIDAKGCTASKMVTVTDNGSDLYESNNSRTAAKTINLGQNVLARIGTATDQDWFKFTTTAAGGGFTVTISHPSVNYTTVLQTTAGVVVTPDSQSPGEKNYTLQPNTAYVVQVTGAQSPVCYLLQVVSGIAVEVLTAKPAEETIPQSLAAKAYPNPHEGSFIIEVESPVTGEGTIVLYDLQGRALAERRENLKAGNNQVRFFNMKQMSYIYRVFIGKHSASGKLLGVK